MPATTTGITWHERPASHRPHGGLLQSSELKKGPAWAPFIHFGSGGVIALAPSGLSYVGQLRWPRNALFRQSRHEFV